MVGTNLIGFMQLKSASCIDSFYPFPFPLPILSICFSAHYLSTLTFIELINDFNEIQWALLSSQSRVFSVACFSVPFEMLPSQLPAALAVMSPTSVSLCLLIPHSFPALKILLCSICTDSLCVLLASEPSRCLYVWNLFLRFCSLFWVPTVFLMFTLNFTKYIKLISIKTHVFYLFLRKLCMYYLARKNRLAQ